LSQLVKVSLTLPTVLMTPPGEEVPVAAAAEVPVPAGSDSPVGIAVGIDRPVGTAVGKPAGTWVGRAGVCLGNKDTLMLVARPPVCFMRPGKVGRGRMRWSNACRVGCVKLELQ
jgi:hypothetical protein